MSRSARRAAAAILVLSLAPMARAGPDDDPPSPPESQAEYPHKSFVHHEFGTGARSYWLFEPTEPKPERAPVIVFHHGWLSTNPGVYGAWIEHLARRGYVVIYPRYQDDWATRPAEFLPNALAAVRDALDVLQTSPYHVRPDRGRFALLGHSAGGNLSALMAAGAAESGLPAPRAVIALMPGEVLAQREPSLAKVPAETLLVVVAAEHDRIVGDLRARQIYAGATAVPPSRKKYVLYRTDRHGFPHLVAGHVAPTAALARLDNGDGPMRTLQMSEAELNAFDSHGFWRLADVTLDAAFAGRTLDEATGRGALFRDLGRWSDGRAVIPPLVGDDLSTIPRVFPSNGLKLLPWTAAAMGSPGAAERMAEGR